MKDEECHSCKEEIKTGANVVSSFKEGRLIYLLFCWYCYLKLIGDPNWEYYKNMEDKKRSKK